MVDVSIIIPTRNRPELLQRALATVNKQAGSLTTECIVVDDGSSATADQIRTLVTDAGGYYYSTGLDGGLGGAAARNLGILHATGEFVAFLDDDDTWMENKLQMQITFMKQSDCQMSYTGMHIVSKQGRQRYSFRKPSSNDHFRAIMRRNFIGTTSTVVIHKKVIDECGGFDPGLPALQDYDLYIRILRNYRVGWIEAPLTTYFTELTCENVSAGRQRFAAAVKVLSAKYRTDPLYYLMRMSFVEIFLLKCFRSPQFLSETVRALVKI